MTKLKTIKKRRERATRNWEDGNRSKYAIKTKAAEVPTETKEKTLTDKEEELKNVGSFYNDSKNNQAYTYAHKKGTKLIWLLTETYLDFINKCFTIL